jgi:quercetin dioxygenase-like cupin family protein
VSPPTDESGDPACWAHLVEDDGLVAADLTSLLPVQGDGVHWTLVPDSDLNANLVRLDPGHAIAEHVNEEVDVLLVTLAGSGRVVAGTRSIILVPAVVAHVPKGVPRSVHAGANGLGYLTVHRRSGGLTIGPLSGAAGRADR